MNTVLVIESDHDLRVELRRHLEGLGYFIFSAGSAVDGLAVLQRIKTPCVVLLSTTLSLMAYDEFLLLKSRESALADIPVILLANSKQELPSGLEVQAIVLKPLNMQTLEKTIRKFCE